MNAPATKPLKRRLTKRQIVDQELGKALGTRDVQAGLAIAAMLPDGRATARRAGLLSSLIDIAAANGDHEACLTFILKRGAYWTYKSPALTAAAGKGSLRVCEALVQHFYVPDPKDCPALVAALRNGHYDVARFLIECGARHGPTPLFPRDRHFLANLPTSEINIARRLWPKFSDEDLADRCRVLGNDELAYAFAANQVRASPTSRLGSRAAR